MKIHPFKMASGWMEKSRHSILSISRKSVHSYLSIGDNHCNRCANKTLLIPRLFAKIVCTPRYAIFISLVKFIWMSRNAFFFSLRLFKNYLYSFLSERCLFFLNDHHIDHGKFKTYTIYVFVVNFIILAFRNYFLNVFKYFKIQRFPMKIWM